MGLLHPKEITVLFPAHPSDHRKLDTVETTARIIEMTGLLRTFATNVEGLPRSEDLVLMFASSLIGDGRWRGFAEGEPVPGGIQAAVVFMDDQFEDDL